MLRQGLIHELIVDIKIISGDKLEERLSIEIDIIEGCVFLVVDVGVGESE